MHCCVQGFVIVLFKRKKKPRNFIRRIETLRNEAKHTTITENDKLHRFYGTNYTHKKINQTQYRYTTRPFLIQSDICSSQSNKTPHVTVNDILTYMTYLKCFQRYKIMIHVIDVKHLKYSHMPKKPCKLSCIVEKVNRNYFTIRNDRSQSIKQ